MQIQIGVSVIYSTNDSVSDCNNIYCQTHLLIKESNVIFRVLA